MHVRARRAALERAKLFEVRSGRRSQHHRKLVRFQAAEAGRQPIDRIVRAGKRPVSAGARGLERERHVGLLAGSQFKELALAILGTATAAIEIDDQRGGDQIAVLFEKKCGAIRVAAGLFIGGERGDEVSIGAISLLLQADQRLDQSRVAVLHVNGAAPVEPAILFSQEKRIDGPILPFGLHDV